MCIEDAVLVIGCECTSACLYVWLFLVHVSWSESTSVFCVSFLSLSLLKFSHMYIPSLATTFTTIQTLWLVLPLYLSPIFFLFWICRRDFGRLLPGREKASTSGDCARILHRAVSAGSRHLSSWERRTGRNVDSVPTQGTGCTAWSTTRCVQSTARMGEEKAWWSKRQTPFPSPEQTKRQQSGCAQVQKSVIAFVKGWWVVWVSRKSGDLTSLSWKHVHFCLNLSFVQLSLN